MKEEYLSLAELLEKRLAVIANHQLRESDPDEQLRQLQEVSESIIDLQNNLSDIPPRLKHFLENCSYDKALDWLQQS